MTRTVFRRLILISSLLVAALCAGAIYVLTIVLSDSHSFSSGTVAHLILIRSETIRDFPRLRAANENVRFLYSAREGTSPGRIDMRFVSTASGTQLPTAYAEFCRKSGYTLDSLDKLIAEAAVACEAPDYRIELVFRPAATGTAVTAVFLER